MLFRVERGRNLMNKYFVINSIWLESPLIEFVESAEREIDRFSRPIIAKQVSAFLNYIYFITKKDAKRDNFY